VGETEFRRLAVKNGLVGRSRGACTAWSYSKTDY
jgi:hypothetical protein